jgi:hypothetical protein
LRLPLGFVLAFLRKLSRLRSGSTIVDNDGTGGGGGGGGEYNGECLFDNDWTMTNKTTMMNTTTWRMGRGRAGEQTMGGNPTTMVTTSSVGCLSGAWGGGHQSSAPTPPSSTATTRRIAAAAVGRHAPPLRSVLSRRMPLVVVDVADHGQRRRHEGVWGVVVRVVEEEEVGAIVLVRQVPIHPGVDDGGKRRGVTLVGLCGSQRQAGGGGGGGAAL